MLIIILLSAMFIVGTVMFIGNLDTLAMFNWDFRMTLQHLGFIDKDVAYATYLRDVVMPKKKIEREEMQRKTINHYIKEEILEGIAGDRRISICVDRSIFDGVSREERLDMISKVADEYGYVLAERGHYYVYLEQKESK